MINEEMTNLPVVEIAFPEVFGHAGTGQISVTVTNVGSGPGSWIPDVMSLTAPTPLPANECILVYSATTHQNLIDTDISSWFDAALAELDGVEDEAKTEGYAPPSRSVIEAAGDLLVLLHTEFPALNEPSVYPTEEGDVEIAFGRADVAATVLIVCQRDGSAICFSHIEGKNSRLRRDDQRDLPDAFLREQLSMLLDA